MERSCRLLIAAVLKVRYNGLGEALSMAFCFSIVKKFIDFNGFS